MSFLVSKAIEYKSNILEIIRDNFVFLSVIVIFKFTSYVINIHLNRNIFFGHQISLAGLINITFLIYLLFFIYKLITNLKFGFFGLKVTTEFMLNEFINFKSMANLTLIIFCIPIFLFSFTSIKTSIPYFNAFYLDEILSELDYIIHFNNHPWQLVNFFINNKSITLIIEYIYHIVLAFLLFSAIIITNLKFTYAYRKQFLLSFIFTWIIVGSFLAIIFSSAGPCYYSNVCADESPYIGLLSYLNSIDNLKINHLQQALWNVYLSGTPTYYTGISAMPSIHVASSTLIAILGWKINKLVGTILTVFLILIQIGSVHLGWHYAIDGYASIIITITIWKVIGYTLQKPDGSGSRTPSNILAK